MPSSAVVSRIRYGICYWTTKQKTPCFGITGVWRHRVVPPQFGVTTLRSLYRAVRKNSVRQHTAVKIAYYKPDLLWYCQVIALEQYDKALWCVSHHSTAMPTTTTHRNWCETRSLPYLWYVYLLITAGFVRDYFVCDDREINRSKIIQSAPDFSLIQREVPSTYGSFFYWSSTWGWVHVSLALWRRLDS